MDNLTCFVVGDSRTGKSNFINTLLNNPFETEVTPTEYEIYTNVKIGDNCVVDIWDFSGTHFIRREVDLYFVCFSIENRVSFENVRNRWLPEIRQYIPRIPVLIVGTKLDLRYNSEKTAEALMNNNREPVSFIEGIKLKNEVEADGYFECSSLTRKGLNSIFYQMQRILSKF